MLIDNYLLETTCKNTIETILLCLESSIKGTIYRIGPMPDLQAVRVTSGVREEGTGLIRWGLPGVSDYNYPGKLWLQYRDQPGRPLEALAWCVEKQKSWTSDDPYANERSVRKQVAGEVEDFHHMEPVLVGKKEMYGKALYTLQYPEDFQANPIWQQTDYIVVAIIKIHFHPNTIKRGDNSTRIIKRLSRTLGTEMLSLYLRESLLVSQREFDRHRLESCNLVAHELRNTLMKLGLLFGAINSEISFLREQWEMEIKKACPELRDKRCLLDALNELALTQADGADTSPELPALANQLISEQKQLCYLSLLPQQEEQWLDQRLLPKWDLLFSAAQTTDAYREKARALLDELRKAIWAGMTPEIVQKLTDLPEELASKWSRLLYTRFSAETIPLLDEVMQLLQSPGLRLPHREHSRKVISSLNALIKIIPEVEKRTNNVITCLKNGLPHEEEP